MKKKLYLTSQSNDTYLGKLSVADNLKTRMKGLLGTPSLSEFQGLLIKPCKQVHTIGMSYPISVWFISKDHQILKIIPSLKPFRISPYVQDSCYVIEFPENWSAKTECNEGDYVSHSPTLATAFCQPL